MQIIVNGKERELPEGLTLAGLLEALGIRGRFAVEVNGEIVPRGRYATDGLKESDRVEVVRAIGGG
ncbi:MAG: sulfur carrier protein ThiS [Beggiatoa sp.]|nr:sulfur carrier protein ThiS [Beggiatoa sp.]